MWREILNPIKKDNGEKSKQISTECNVFVFYSFWNSNESNTTYAKTNKGLQST